MAPFIGGFFHFIGIFNVSFFGVNFVMKKRILVMNGQKIVQSEAAAGKWANDRVDKAGSLKPNIYNIYLAKEASLKSNSIGTIIHADEKNIYQQIGREFVMHDRRKFDKVPDIGSVQSISYDESTGKIKISPASVTNSKKLSR